MELTPKTGTALAACALGAALAWAQPAEPPPGDDPRAGALEWLDREFGYVANNESLRSLLYDFGTTLGVPVIVSADINVIVDDQVPVMAAERFLAEVHTRFGLIWVFDGTTLYLYDDAEAVSETVAFPFARRDDFKSTVDGASVRGVPLEWIFLPAQNALQLSGPPRFVEWGKEVAEDLGASIGSAAADDSSFAIRIFEVEYGYIDQAGGAAGGAAAIAGLAEMVAKLMNVAHVSGVARVGSGPGRTGGVPKLRGTGVIPVDAPVDAEPAPAPGIVGARGPGDEAFVIGDPRLNAIVVRDREDRMPAYERLIAALDSPLDQIEIEISVLDIDASAAEELRFAFESDSVQVNAGGDADGNTIYYSENLWDLDGIALRIRALRNQGKSRVLTRPSVTTLDNHEASFTNNRTFYVRLGGNDAESVDLAPVSYGWVVRIRPHVIYDADYNRVQLSVHIEDGNRGGPDLSVTGVPEVAQNVIQTQAVVREGNSLLIGGYTVREQTRFRQRIPLLGHIPVMGRLFSTRVDRDQSVARYFLITPRILPATISYEINTGFEGEPVDTIDAVVPVTGRVLPEEPTPRPAPAAPPVRRPVPDASPVEDPDAAGEPHVAPDPVREVALADPGGRYAVQVIALSSAQRLDAFVEDRGLQDMLRVTRDDVERGRFLLFEGIYADLSAAKSAADRLRGDGFEAPYVRPLASLKTRAAIR